jgi:hypothetical protein
MRKIFSLPRFWRNLQNVGIKILVCAIIGVNVYYIRKKFLPNPVGKGLPKFGFGARILECRRALAALYNYL